jgi:hypothetical protein
MVLFVQDNDMSLLKMMFAVACFAMFGSFAQADDLSPSDQARVAVQAICPVSGEKLGAHGQPIKVKIGEEEVFLCCRSCLQGQVKPEHWGTIHANFARAQKICPVMKHDLPPNPKWTIVEGRIVYVCCPPCTQKIAADPETYLQAVDELYSASLQARQNAQ